MAVNDNNSYKQNQHWHLVQKAERRTSSMIRATRLYIVFVLKDWIGQFAAAEVNLKIVSFLCFHGLHIDPSD